MTNSDTPKLIQLLVEKDLEIQRLKSIMEIMERLHNTTNKTKDLEIWKLQLDKMALLKTTEDLQEEVAYNYDYHNA